MSRFSEMPNDVRKSFISSIFTIGEMMLEEEVLRKYGKTAPNTHVERGVGVFQAVDALIGPDAPDLNDPALSDKAGEMFTRLEEMYPTREALIDAYAAVAALAGAVDASVRLLQAYRVMAKFNLDTQEAVT